jgi:hypothetical protein
MNCIDYIYFTLNTIGLGLAVWYYVVEKYSQREKVTQLLLYKKVGYKTPDFYNTFVNNGDNDVFDIHKIMKECNDGLYFIIINKVFSLHYLKFKNEQVCLKCNSFDENCIIDLDIKEEFKVVFSRERGTFILSLANKEKTVHAITDTDWLYEFQVDIVRI